MLFRNKIKQKIIIVNTKQYNSDWKENYNRSDFFPNGKSSPINRFTEHKVQ